MSGKNSTYTTKATKCFKIASNVHGLEVLPHWYLRVTSPMPSIPECSTKVFSFFLGQSLIVLHDAAQIRKDTHIHSLSHWVRTRRQWPYKLSWLKSKNEIQQSKSWERYHWSNKWKPCLSVRDNFSPFPRIFHSCYPLLTTKHGEFGNYMAIQSYTYNKYITNNKIATIRTRIMLSVPIGLCHEQLS